MAINNSIVALTGCLILLYVYGCDELDLGKDFHVNRRIIVESWYYTARRRVYCQLASWVLPT